MGLMSRSSHLFLFFFRTKTMSINVTMISQSTCGSVWTMNGQEDVHPSAVQKGDHATTTPNDRHRKQSCGAVHPCIVGSVDQPGKNYLRLHQRSRLT